MRIEIVPYNAQWPLEFTEIAKEIRRVMGDMAESIHHIGSTSVIDLPAKDVIDIQVTVNDLDCPELELLESIGLVKHQHIDRDHCPPGMTLEAKELRKQIYHKPRRRMNIHIREFGRFNQRYALLCRDFLRTHKMAADSYAEIKKQLARYFPENSTAYYDIKDPVFDVIMAGANEWADKIDWQIPASDA